jgi:hypothetical protein
MGIEELIKLAGGSASTANPIAGLVSGGIQGIAGLVGNIQAKKRYREAENAFNRAQSSRPTFQISPEIKQQLAMEQAQYNAEDQSIKQARAAQEQALANYMGSAQRNASSGTQALATAGEVAGNSMQNAARLSAQQFQNQMQKGQSLAGAQGAMAQQRGLQFQDALNANQERQSFELGKMQAYRNDINQSNKNIFSALPSVAMGAAGLFAPDQEQKLLDKALSNVKVKPTGFNTGKAAFRIPENANPFTRRSKLQNLSFETVLPNSVPTVAPNPFVAPQSNPYGSPTMPSVPFYVQNPLGLQNPNLIRPFGIGPVNQKF